MAKRLSDLDPLEREKIRKRREAGDVKRRANGTLIDLNGEMAGGGLSRFDRNDMQNWITIASVALAEGKHAEWEDALEALRTVMRRNDWQHNTFLSVCQDIEDLAVEMTGNPHVGDYGRSYLASKKGKLFFGPQ